MSDKTFVTPFLPDGIDLPEGIGSMPLAERAAALRERATDLRQRAAAESPRRAAILSLLADAFEATAASPDLAELTNDPRKDA
jgi:hypothetical protein